MKKQHGFNLIELMIVVAIISILAGVAIPGYSKYTRKAHRSDAQQLLLDIANRQELYLLNARQYTDSVTTLNITKEGWSCSGTTCSDNFYDAVVSKDNTASPPTWSITATAKGSQDVNNDEDLTLDSTGAKTHNGVSGW